jgi:hypothetical protein
LTFCPNPDRFEMEFWPDRSIVLIWPMSGLSRSTAIRHMKMLRVARMAGLVKLRCSVNPCRQRPE